MKEFFINNWEIIAVLTMILITLLVSIFKKSTKVVDNVWSIIISLLPSLIVSAEKTFGAGKGVDKMAFVLSAVISFLTDKMHFDEGQVASYIPKIQEEIEAILSTPQKKEGDLSEK